MTRSPAALGNLSREALFLCYHSINVRGPEYLSLSPETFERQLAMLRSRDFRSGDLAALRSVADSAPSDGPYAFLTFDDGFEDNFTHALPLLKAYGLAAWVFVLPPLVDRQAAFGWPEVREYAEDFPDVMRSLSWEMVEEMAEAGMVIGSHGLSHSHLPQLGDEELTEELWQSRAQIKSRLGSCDSFAYPFGEWDPRVEAAAARAGYSFAFTSPWGRQRKFGSLTIPRLPIDARDRSWRFKAKLSAPGRRVFLSPVRPMLQRVRTAARFPGATDR